MQDVDIASGPLKEQAERVVKTLKSRGDSVVTAESCTAGLLAALLSKVDGAGDILKGGFICYAKDHKTVALGVPAKLLEQQSAVSGDVAAAMAKGALERSNATIALAITGVFGPKADEDGNPVGLVFLARQDRDGGNKIEHREFGDQPHSEVCALTLKAALDLLEGSGA